jgi:hypothetical protein
MGAEEGHGATGTETASGNLTRRDPGLIIQGDGGKTESRGNVMGTDVSPRTIDKNGVQRGVRRGMVITKVLYPAGQGLDGANVGMAHRAMADGFSADGIFLVRKDELGKGGRVKLGKGSHKGVKATGTDVEEDVA